MNSDDIQFSNRTATYDEIMKLLKEKRDHLFFATFENSYEQEMRTIEYLFRRGCFQEGYLIWEKIRRRQIVQS
jgi:hypothetical protein